MPGPEPWEEGACKAPGTHTAFGDVVGIPHDVPRQAKVTDLHQLPLTDEDIPGSQVTVHTLWGDTEHCHCEGPSHSLRTQPSSSTNPFLGLQGQESPHMSGISLTSRDNHGLTTSRATTFLLFAWTASSVTATATRIQQRECEQPSREGIARARTNEGTWWAGRRGYLYLCLDNPTQHPEDIRVTPAWLVSPTLPTCWIFPCDQP